MHTQYTNLHNAIELCNPKIDKVLLMKVKIKSRKCHHIPEHVTLSFQKKCSPTILPTQKSLPTQLSWYQYCCETRLHSSANRHLICPELFHNLYITDSQVKRCWGVNYDLTMGQSETSMVEISITTASISN